MDQSKEKDIVNTLILDLNNSETNKKIYAIKNIDKIISSISKERVKANLIPYIISKL